MKPADLNSFNTLSNLAGKGTTLVVQSTRMDFNTNTYVSELWKRSNGKWKSFKSGIYNFSNPKFGDKENNIFGYVKKQNLSKDKSEQKIERFALDENIDTVIISLDSKSRSINLSIKELEIQDEKEALDKYGSSDSGASLGDILGSVLKK